MHHIIRESDLKHACPYCGRSTQTRKWESSFDSNKHYKVLECMCGRKVSIRMPFSGSGHDDWGLDKKVEEAVKS